MLSELVTSWWGRRGVWHHLWGHASSIKADLNRTVMRVVTEEGYKAWWLLIQMASTSTLYFLWFPAAHLQPRGTHGLMGSASERKRSLCGSLSNLHSFQWPDDVTALVAKRSQIVNGSMRKLLPCSSMNDPSKHLVNERMYYQIKCDVYILIYSLIKNKIIVFIKKKNYDYEEHVCRQGSWFKLCFNSILIQKSMGNKLFFRHCSLTS